MATQRCCLNWILDDKDSFVKWRKRGQAVLTVRWRCASENVLFM